MLDTRTIAFPAAIPLVDATTAAVDVSASPTVFAVQGIAKYVVFCASMTAVPPVAVEYHSGAVAAALDNHTGRPIGNPCAGNVIATPLSVNELFAPPYMVPVAVTDVDEVHGARVNAPYDDVNVAYRDADPTTVVVALTTPPAPLHLATDPLPVAVLIADAIDVHVALTDVAGYQSLLAYSIVELIVK